MLSSKTIISELQTQVNHKHLLPKKHCFCRGYNFVTAIQPSLNSRISTLEMEVNKGLAVTYEQGITMIICEMWQEARILRITD